MYNLTHCSVLSHKLDLCVPPGPGPAAGGPTVTQAEMDQATRCWQYCTRFASHMYEVGGMVTHFVKLIQFFAHIILQ